METIFVWKAKPNWFSEINKKKKKNLNGKLWNKIIKKKVKLLEFSCQKQKLKNIK